MDATRLNYRPRALVVGVGYIEHPMISNRSAAWLLVVPSAFNLFRKHCEEHDYRVADSTRVEDSTTAGLCFARTSNTVYFISSYYNQASRFGVLAD